MTQKLSWRDTQIKWIREIERVWIIIMYFFLYVAFKENFDLQIKKKEKKEKKKKEKKERIL